MSEMSAMLLPFSTVILQTNDPQWYDTKTFSVVVGVLIGFIINKIDTYFKEKAELDRYEYAVLSKTENILENRSKNEKYINAFMLRLIQDLRFAKLESSKPILNSLTKALDGNNDIQEKTEITNRLTYLKEGSLISRNTSKLKNYLWPFS